ncbi:hypothetical protein PUR61_08315 [Streptomyces sp. BE20]|uniref:hypothetical protein n=1 Tax=unclassified Streptomyces TaxID=2593676 RepID=UPI002E761E7B|nr:MULTISPECIES: hypothetical protein [unclassified Streptomyces]MED7951133.1 hypothetical protein [Streptomyces sp. BE303]MEE1822198.1 hypothetical protein [Streptomyces sp. BE20]
MSVRRPTLRCRLTVLVAIGVPAVLSATPAHAASSPGGSISREEVIQRAQSWVTQGVSYDQGAFHTDSNGTYRQDCSGYVSMAWHLTDSLVTQTLPSVSTEIAATDLEPGDALNYTAQHVILFGDWIDKSAGTFHFYAENNPRVLTSQYQGDLNASSLAGWPTSYYTPYRYNRITGTGADVPATTPITPTTPAAPTAPPADATPSAPAPTRPAPAPGVDDDTWWRSGSHAWWRAW